MFFVPSAEVFETVRFTFSCVSLTTVMLCTETPEFAPVLICVAVSRFVPVNTVDTVLLRVPLLGAIDVSVGAAASTRTCVEPVSPLCVARTSTSPTATNDTMPVADTVATDELLVDQLDAVVTSVDGIEPDYFVRAVRENNRDELILSVVSEADQSQFATIGDEVAKTLQDRLGVKIQVEVVAPGAIDHLTEVNISPKLKRFRDERG